MTGPLRIAARIHAYPPHQNAGAEWFLHPLLTALAGRGHQAEVRLMRPIPGQKQYELDGIKVYPDTVLHHPRPDVFVTHLEFTMGTAALARGLGVPLVVVQHNTRDGARNALRHAGARLTVCNSEWMLHELGDPPDSIVVHPPADPGMYQTAPGGLVTLINLTRTKGGELFREVARRMPETQFLGVQGAYGVQVIPDLPNVTVLESVDGRRMRDEVYARTRILLVPSDYESWGRVATEAMSSGIPVIAHPAEGALAENLGGAAIWAHRDKPEEWVRQIRRLAKPEAWQKASEAALKQFATFDPAGELDRWCAAVEAL